MIAIDILIEPDSRMMERAKSVNARLRRNYAEGFTFDESHVPHLTLVQRYVRADDVDALARALARYLRPGPMLPIDLQATGYEAASSDAIRTVVCLVERAPGLIHLASRAEEAVRPFALGGGTADAFFGAPTEPIDPGTIRYVEEFVPARVGERFEPHVTFGRAHADFVETLLGKPFEPFAFSGDNLAIYHLGNHGTARKPLWTLVR